MKAPVATGWQFTICCRRGAAQALDFSSRRRGREAEGGGLLNRYTVKSRIEGSNPSVSANTFSPICTPLNRHQQRLLMHGVADGFGEHFRIDRFAEDGRFRRDLADAPQRLSVIMGGDEDDGRIAYIS
jgi:hypothetical protein